MSSPRSQFLRHQTSQAYMELLCLPESDCCCFLRGRPYRSCYLNVPSTCMWSVFPLKMLYVSHRGSIPCRQAAKMTGTILMDAIVPRLHRRSKYIVTRHVIPGTVKLAYFTRNDLERYNIALEAFMERLHVWLTASVSCHS